MNEEIIIGVGCAFVSGFCFGLALGSYFQRKRRKRKTTYIEQPRLTEQDYAVITVVKQERCRQYKKWGDQHHTSNEWWWILQEELTEAKCKMELKFSKWDIVQELVETTAVLHAWIKDLMFE